LALAPGRFGQSISKITSVPIFMLLYKFAHSLMRIPLTALTNPFNGPLSRTTQNELVSEGQNQSEFTEARDSEWQWHHLHVSPDR